MPWHAVQFARITFHTGPSGRSIFGRVALFPWAARGSATAIPMRRKRMRLQRKCLRARTERFLGSDLAPGHVVLGNVLDAVLVQQGEKHVGSSLGVIGEY